MNRKTQIMIETRRLTIIRPGGGSLSPSSEHRRTMATTAFAYLSEPKNKSVRGNKMLRNTICIGSLLVVALFIVMFQTIETKAAWGDFDTSFGFQGLTIDTITGYTPRNVAIQPDGKILVTGHKPTVFGGEGFFLRRYLSNGQLDTAFGKNGAAVSPEVVSVSSDYWGENIIVQANGKIAVSGTANGYYAVWQFTSKGANDTSFGQDGLQILTQYRKTASSSTFPEINIQSGKILLTLYKVIGNIPRIVLLRLNSNDAIDQTFGNLGESLTDFYGDASSGQFNFGTVVEGNGKITVAGKSSLESPFWKGLERKLANGQPDSTFSPTPSFSGGFVFLPGLVKTAAGKYVVRSFNFNTGGSTLSLDKFGSTGGFESSLSPLSLPAGYASRCPDIFTGQSDGKILVGFFGLLLRLNNELDFNTMETKYCTNLPAFFNGTRAAALQPDDKMVFAGIYNNYLMIVRLLPN